MGNRSSVQKYYKLLFKLPSYTVLMALLGLILLLVFVIAGSLSVFVGTLLLSFTASLAVYGYGIIGSKALSRVKRILGFYIASLIISMPLLIIGRITFSGAALLLILSGLSALTTFYLMGFSNTDTRSIAYAFFASLMLYIGYTFLSPGKYVEALLFSFIPPVVNLGIIKYVNRHRVKDIPASHIGAAFFNYKLEGDRGIEEVFTALSSKGVIRPYVLFTDRVAVAYTDIHYGPFGDIGSSDMPSVLARRFKESGRIPIILHGMGSHERNIASRRLSLDIVNKIARIIDMDGKCRECIPYDVFRLARGEWEATVFLFSCIALVFLSRRGGIDDLPYSIQLYAWKRSVEAGVQPLIIIDSHNCELTKVPPNLDELYGLIDDVVGIVAKLPYKPVPYRIGVARARGTGIAGLIDEASFLIMDFNGRKACLAYLPGNNMEPGARDRVVEKLRKLGCAISEVITNDEHKATGVEVGEAYTPIQYSNGLNQLIEQLYMRAEKSLREEILYYCSFEESSLLQGNSIMKIKWFLEKLFYRVALLVLLNIWVTPLAITLILCILE